MVLDPDAAYRALQARDARFNGRPFVGVTSTGIHCRPVCRVRTPQRLLMAKRRLTGTAQPVAQVALASGFASLRRFNAAFAERWRPWRAYAATRLQLMEQHR